MIPDYMKLGVDVPASLFGGPLIQPLPRCKCQLEAQVAEWAATPKTTCGWCERETPSDNRACNYCRSDLWVFGEGDLITKEK